MNIDFKLIVILIIVLYCYANKNSKNIEFFGNYKSQCDYLPRAIKYALEKRNIKKVNDNSWDYYLPCEYTRCESNILAFQNENTGRKIFMIDGCDSIASKIAIWNLIKLEYNEKAKDIMPNTFVLLNKKDKLDFIKFYKRKKKENPKSKFILKNYQQRQEGLKLENDLEKILNAENKGFILVQDFLENPYLISGRKINFRYYLLIICKNDKIQAWVHKNGFVYYTPKPFEKFSMEFTRTITTGYIDRKIYEKNPLTLEDFRKYLGKEKTIKFDKDAHNLLYFTMKALANKICSNKKLKKHTKFQLFGADLAPDENLNCKLMEINKGPDIGFKDDRDGDVKKKVINDIFTVVDNDITKQHDFIKIF